MAVNFSQDKIKKAVTTPGSFKETLSSLSTPEDQKLLFRLMFQYAAGQKTETKQQFLYRKLIKPFKLACKMFPDDPDMWVVNGILHYRIEKTLKRRKKEFEEAIASFQKALALKYDYFSAYHLLGCTYFHRTLSKGEFIDFSESEDHFQKALSFSKGGSKESLSQLYWDWAIKELTVANASGEASDLNRAIGFLRKAHDLGLDNIEFLFDFSEALIRFADLLNKHDSFYEAVLLLKKAENSLKEKKSLDDESKEQLSFVHLLLGKISSILFATSLKDDDFNQAQDHFRKATQTVPSHPKAWQEWGELLFTKSKLGQDVPELEECLEKYEEARLLESSDPVFLSNYARALCVYGLHMDEFECLKEAFSFIQKAISQAPESPLVLGAKAEVHCYFGRYFSDPRYFVLGYKMLEAFRETHKNDVNLALGQAQICYFLGENLHNTELLEEGNFLFSFCSTRGPGRTGYFWNQWGCLLILLGELTHEKSYYDEAEKCYDKALSLHATPPPEWLSHYGQVLDALATLTQEESYYERAIKAYQGALAFDPSFVTARNGLAYTMTHFASMIGDLSLFQKACASLEKITESDPENDVAWSEYGLALAHIADLTYDEILPQDPTLLEKAERCFLKALNLGAPESYYNLASLYSYQKRIEESLKYLEKAFSANALPPIEMMQSDDWLDNIRSHQVYKDIISKLDR